MPVTIRLFQYNCHLFEGTVVCFEGKQCLDGVTRIADIARTVTNECKTHTLVTLCEVWADTVKTAMQKAWQQVHKEKNNAWFDPDKAVFYKIGSGLLFLSTAEIISHEFEQFKNLVGGDSMSQKGFYTLKLRLSGYAGDVYLIQTHTQAQLDGSEFAPSQVAVQKNLDQIVNKVKRLPKGSPLIVTGDLNIEEIKKPYSQGELSDSYTLMKQKFGALGLQDAFRKYHPVIKDDPGYTYDWQLLGDIPPGKDNPLIKRFAPIDITNRLEQRLDYTWVSDHFQLSKAEACYNDKYMYTSPEYGTGTPLSDHYPLAVEVTLT